MATSFRKSAVREYFESIVIAVILALFIQKPGLSSDLHEVTSFDVRERYGPVTVPPDQLFMMGDNRDNSQDSRYWGFLPRDYVKGKALVIYWSYEADREDYQDEGT